MEYKFGLSLSLCDPTAIEMAARAGYSFVRLDWEHMMFDSGTAINMIRTARLLAIPVHVRVSGMHNVTALLDLGVNGIMVPHVDSKRVALEAVKTIKYAPLGERGMNGAARVLDFGRTSFSDYVAHANEEVKLIVQIEDTGGLKELEEILALPGVDMVATGKMDLSQALGVPGDTKNHKVVEAEELVIKKAVMFGKSPIIKADSKERIRELAEMGVRWFHVGRDEALLNGAMKKLMKEIAE